MNKHNSTTNGQIKIEKGVKIPSCGQAGKGRWQKFLSCLDVNDSFVVTPANQGAIWAAAKKLGITVTSRLCNDKKNRRIWRTK